MSNGREGKGFEPAKLLSEKGNKVVITGRDQDRVYKIFHLSGRGSKINEWYPLRQKK